MTVRRGSVRVKMEQIKCSDVPGLEAMDALGLVDVVCFIIAVLARCDARGVEVPEDFITHLGVVRSVLMRKSVKGDYTEREFLRFFGMMLKYAGEEYGATPERMASLEAMNQLVQ